MAIQELSTNNALIAGSDLWILPDSELSQWCDKLDWYINFQLSKTKAIQKQKITQSLQQVIREEELDASFEFDYKDSPLMIVASKNLPCHFIIQVPFKDTQSWLSELQVIQKKMNSSKLRVFLPKQISSSEFATDARNFFSEKVDVSLVNSI